MLTGVVPYQNSKRARSDRRRHRRDRPPWLSVVVKFAALAGLTTVILVLLFGQTRILFAIAQDGLLPQFFARIHPRFHTPCGQPDPDRTGRRGRSPGCFPIGLLGEMVSIGTLVAFAAGLRAVIYLRRSHPDTPRPFRVPGSPALPVSACSPASA